MPATKEFSFIELKNNRDRWLAEWMPQQKAKGVRGTFRGVSTDAKTRMSHCLAGCMVLDMRDAGRDIDTTKLESQAEWQPYVRTLFTTFESKSTCFVRTFKQEYVKVFGKSLSMHQDDQGIILSTATRDYLKTGAMPVRLADKMLTLRRKVGIIEQTIDLLNSCVDDTRFGAMETFDVVNEGKLVRKVAEVRAELEDEGFDAIARRHETGAGAPERSLSNVLQRLEQLESTWHDTIEEPNPWFEQTSELYYRLCLRVLEAPKLSNVTTTTRLGPEVGATVTRKDLEDGLEAEARACGLLHAAIETEIVFEKAKLTFKAGVQAGGEVRAGGKLQHGTREGVVNSLVSGKSPVLASASGELEAWVGFKANAQFSLESDWLDVEAEASVEGGAFAKASGKAEITATGASVALSLEAFVGLRASGKVKVRKKIFGFPVLEQEVGASVTLGVGGKLEVKAGADLFKGVNFTFAAEATVGIGTGVESSTTVNHYNLGLATHRAAEELWNLGHNLQVRSQGYSRFGEAEEMDRALLIRLVTDLEARQLGYERELGELETRARQAGPGMTMHM